MWVQLRAEIGRHIYIAICYFAPSNSSYAAPRDLNPYSDLNDDILEFSADGDIILLGDFNARTGQSQTVFYDTSETMLQELDTTKLGLTRHSQDEVHTEYGKYLIDLGSTHGLAILNGLQRFSAAGGFTCFPHRHGASTVDYVLSPPSLIPYIQDLTVGPKPIGVAVDHALLTWNLSFQGSMHPM